MNIRDDLSRKCPICGSDERGKKSCNHLLVVLRYVELYYIEGLDNPNDFSEEDMRKEEDMSQSYVEHILDWTERDVRNKYSPDIFFDNPRKYCYLGDRLRISVGSDDYLEDGSTIIPFSWGSAPLNEKGLDDFLFSLLEYFGPHSSALLRVIKATLDELSNKNQVVRTNVCHNYDDCGNYHGEVVKETFLEHDNTCLVHEIEYWKKEEDFPMVKVDEYLRLFFSLTQRRTIYSVSALEWTLREIKEHMEQYKSWCREQQKPFDEKFRYAFVPPHLLDQIFFIAGEGPLLRTGCPVDWRVRVGNSTRDAYEQEFDSFKAFMATYNIDEKLHIMIKQVWQFISSYEIGRGDLDTDIVNIENMFPLLRKCVEALENSLFKQHVGKNKSSNIPRSDILKSLQKKGVVDRYTFDSLEYVYSILSWKTHTTEDIDEAQSINKQPKFLMMILDECFRVTFYDLLPRAIIAMNAGSADSIKIG